MICTAAAWPGNGITTSYPVRLWLKFVVTLWTVISGWVSEAAFYFRLTVSNQISVRQWNVRGGADKSLARPTLRCRSAESIVSLERAVCSCAELQVFSCYRGWKEACQATRAISTTWRRELSSFFFLVRQGVEGNSRHSDRNIRGTCTIVCRRQKLGGPV